MSRRFRLYPSEEQESLLLGHCAHARYVWNLALEQRLMWRPWQGSTPGYLEQSRQLTEAREAELWLAEGSFVVQQQALRDHNQAWQNYFHGSHRRPGWRRRGRSEGFQIVGRPAARVCQQNAHWSAVKIPKVGWVRFKRSRDLPEFKSYRVTRDRAGRWHISLTAIPDVIPAPGTGEVVGVDRGATVAAALSTGELTSPAGLRPKEAERLRRLRRRLARARPGSKRREALRLQLARLLARDRDRRCDWIEKTSTDLARRFDVIHIEDLRIRSMTRSARGTTAQQGRNVRQKSGLNRVMLAHGLARLVVRIEQKAPGRVEKVNPAYTSQTCNACGHRARENRKSQAVFLCVACGHRDNADVNAAKNIAAGHVVTARGDLVHQGRSVKREPRKAGRKPTRPSTPRVFA